LAHGRPAWGGSQLGQPPDLQRRKQLVWLGLTSNSAWKWTARLCQGTSGLELRRFSSARWGPAALRWCWLLLAGRADAELGSAGPLQSPNTHFLLGAGAAWRWGCCDPWCLLGRPSDTPAAAAGRPVVGWPELPSPLSAYRSECVVTCGVGRLLMRYLRSTTSSRADQASAGFTRCPACAEITLLLGRSCPAW